MVRNCTKVLLKWPKEPAGDRGSPQGGSVRNVTQEKLAAPFGTRKYSLQWPENCSGEKAAKAAPLPPPLPFPSSCPHWFFFPASFFSFFPVLPGGNFPIQAAFPQENLNLCGTAILGSFLQRRRSPQIFFGLDPLPKAIKAHKELSAQIFNS